MFLAQEETTYPLHHALKTLPQSAQPQDIRRTTKTHTRNGTVYPTSPLDLQKSLTAPREARPAGPTSISKKQYRSEPHSQTHAHPNSAPQILNGTDSKPEPDSSRPVTRPSHERWPTPTTNTQRSQTTHPSPPNNLTIIHQKFRINPQKRSSRSTQFYPFSRLRTESSMLSRPEGMHALVSCSDPIQKRFNSRFEPDLDADYNLLHIASSAG